MNIIVCLKQTFDTEEKIVISEGKINEEGVKYVINPYDEYALEEAIRLREKHGGDVTVITIGPPRAESALRTALAMGADHAVHIDDERCFGDEHSAAKVLAAAINKRPFDLLCCGYMAVDSGAGQVGLRLAEELGIAHISAVTKVEIEEERVTAEHDLQDISEIVEARLPILITAQQGLNEPRYPSLPGIMKAKKKTLQKESASSLKLESDDIAAKSVTTATYAAPAKLFGRKLQGELADQASELVELLQKRHHIASGGVGR